MMAMRIRTFTLWKHAAFDQFDYFMTSTPTSRERPSRLTRLWRCARVARLCVPRMWLRVGRRLPGIAGETVWDYAVRSTSQGLHGGCAHPLRGQLGVGEVAFRSAGIRPLPRTCRRSASISRGSGEHRRTSAVLPLRRVESWRICHKAGRSSLRIMANGRDREDKHYKSIAPAEAACCATQSSITTQVQEQRRRSERRVQNYEAAASRIAALTAALTPHSLAPLGKQVGV